MNNIFGQVDGFFFSLINYLNLNLIFCTTIGLFIFVAISVLFTTARAYESKLIKAIDMFNAYFVHTPQINDDNLVAFNNKMKSKKVPKQLRKQWQQFVLYREDKASGYMSFETCVSNPIRNSSFKRDLTIMNILAYIIAFASLLLNVYITQFSSLIEILQKVLLAPIIVLLLNYIVTIFLNLRHNAIVSDLYQNYQYFEVNIDKATETLPDYVDYEVLFDKNEIKRGIPMLYAYLQKRAEEEKRELERARLKNVEHEKFNFEESGLDGSLVLERAMQEAENYIAERKKYNQDAEQIHSDITQEDLNYREIAKEYNRQMQVSKETFENFKSQLEEASSNFEINYLKKQQQQELDRQRNLERDFDAQTERHKKILESYNEELTSIDKFRSESRKSLETAMMSEFSTFSTKVYDEVSKVVEEREKEEHQKLKSKIKELEEKLLEKTKEIDILYGQNNDLNEMLQNSQNNSDYQEYEQEQQQEHSDEQYAEPVQQDYQYETSEQPQEEYVDNNFEQGQEEYSFNYEEEPQQEQANNEQQDDFYDDYVEKYQEEYSDNNLDQNQDEFEYYNEEQSQQELSDNNYYDDAFGDSKEENNLEDTNTNQDEFEEFDFEEYDATQNQSEQDVANTLAEQEIVNYFDSEEDDDESSNEDNAMTYDYFIPEANQESQEDDEYEEFNNEEELDEDNVRALAGSLLDNEDEFDEEDDENIDSDVQGVEKSENISTETKVESEEDLLKEDKPKKRPGRPRKIVSEPVEKRKPGRPRKEKTEEDTKKRGPGRPRKENVDKSEKRKPGRPRKVEKENVKETKRGPGRPKKEKQSAVKNRKVGRPKKEKIEETKKRGPGRPKKIEQIKQSKRKVGRPKKSDLALHSSDDIEAYLKEIDAAIARENARFEATKKELESKTRISKKRK